jgi:uncharacterized protein
MPAFTASQIALTVVSGVAVGFTLGLVGGGGSMLAVPLLLYLVGWNDPHAVIGTTALAVALTALVNLLPHWSAGTVRWRPAATLALPGVLGAAVGSQIGEHVPGRRLLFLFALLMLAVAAWMLFSTGAHGGATPPRRRRPAYPAIACAGLGVGLLSGVFGIGGGFLVVPALLATARLPIVQAIGSSLVAVFAFGLTTAGAYALAGHVGWVVAALFVAGGVLGGRAGVRLLRRLAPRRVLLTRLFATVLVVVAVYMLALNLQAL